MAGKGQASGGAGSGRTGPAPTRADRLKAALKANIARRKAQAGARGTGSAAGQQNSTDGPQG